MLGKVKQYFGIEGIKINLEFPEIISKNSTAIEGNIVLSSKNTQTAKSFEVRLIEKYSRGRRKNKLINEEVIGIINLNRTVIVSANTTETIPFKLPFQIVKSRMDIIEKEYFLMRGIIKIAKWSYGVKSEYRLEAEADVVGTALDPSFTKKVLIK